MNGYKYINDELFCEEVPVKELVRIYGTPLYIYSYGVIQHNYYKYTRSLANIDHLICYSVKANSNLSLLKLMSNLGAGFDIVSGEELQRVLEIGGIPEKIVYSGVGKSREEIEMALKAGILIFNVESLGELLLINDLAGNLKLRANISFRVNPEVSARTHPYITTGMKENKFGITCEEALHYSSLIKTLPNVNLMGIDCHIGSQITEIEPYLLSVRRLKQLILILIEQGFNIKIFDVGGGLGISYQGNPVPGPEEWSFAIIEEIEELVGIKLIIEPGRSIVANSGILIGKVLYQKSREGKNFLIVDVGMNNLIRPCLYNAYHDIKPVSLDEKETAVFDVVGPLCETADFIGKDRNLPWLLPEDLLAVMDTGAYGFSLASNYNSKPKAAEVLVKGKEFYLIRKRETFEDLTNNEIVPEILK